MHSCASRGLTVGQTKHTTPESDGCHFGELKNFKE